MSFKKKLERKNKGQGKYERRDKQAKEKRNSEPVEEKSMRQKLRLESKTVIRWHEVTLSIVGEKTVGENWVQCPRPKEWAQKYSYFAELETLLDDCLGETSPLFIFND